MPPSQARPFSLSRSVLRNTHTLYRRSSVLERSTLYHRDALSKIQPFFSRADQWALPVPLYPPVLTLAFFVIRHSTGSKISYVSSLRVLSREQSLRATSGGNTRAQMFSSTRGSALYRVRISASFSLSFLVAPLRLSAFSSSHSIPADITALFQFRPNLPECCQFSSAVVVHNITFAVLKGSSYP